MKVKNLNKSSYKTRKLIKNTFAELLKEKKELNKITVSELSKRADINRSTFYTHYDDIYDVAEDFETEMISVLLYDEKVLSSLNDIYAHFDSVISYLKKNEKIYKMLLASNDTLMILERLNYLIRTNLYKSLVNDYDVLDKSSLKYYVSFYTDGTINQILKYFRGIS